MEYVQVKGIGEVCIEIKAKAEDIEIRGNAIASGDDEYDTEIEDEMIKRLSSGDDWVWCVVAVVASVVASDRSISDVEGTSYLGCCSYADEKDFCQEGGCYEDMKEEAIADLTLQLIALKKSLSQMELEEAGWRGSAADEVMKMRGGRTSVTWCYRFVDDQVSSGKKASYEEVFQAIQAGRYGYTWNPRIGKDHLTENPCQITYKRQDDGSYLEEERPLDRRFLP